MEGKIVSSPLPPLRVSTIGIKRKEDRDLKAFEFTLKCFYFLGKVN